MSWLAGLVCHQRLDRLLYADAVLCARCSGLYLGLLAGSLALLMGLGDRTRFPRGGALCSAVVSIVLLLADGLLGRRLYGGSNGVRWLTGLLGGGGMSLLLIPLVLRGLDLETIGPPESERRPQWKGVALVALSLLLPASAPLAPWSPLHRAIDGLATAGVLALWTGLNLGLWGAVRRRPRRTDSEAAGPEPRPARMVLAVLIAMGAAAAEVVFVGWWKGDL